MYERGLYFIALALVLVILGACFRGSQENQPLRAGEYTRRLTVGELERTYLLHIPPGLNPAIPAPVILAFHPGFGTAEGFASKTGLSEQAARFGFVVVYPQGYQRSWNAGDCCGPAQRDHIDDLAFTQAILDDLASVVNIDPQRVFATGFSNGGKMAYRLACEFPSQIKAIAVAGAAISIPDLACRPTNPVPVLHFHGLADRFAPFRGGLSQQEPAGVQRSIPETIALWVARDSCTETTRVTYQQDAATCITHPNCTRDSRVTLCTIEGMGHQWPGGEPVFPFIFGPGTTDISATDMAIDFFRAYSVPDQG